MKRFLVPVLLLTITGHAQAQWLPAERQTHERKLWEATGVEFPAGLQFYELAKVSQRLVGIINYRPVDRYGIFDDKYRGEDGRSKNVNAQFPWITPSGLNNSPKDQWRKVGAAYFPAPVHVYRETIGVLNSFGSRQPQPHLAWSFPDGTIFGELLVRIHAGREWAFEIRTYEVRGGKMTNAETYRPDVPLNDYRKVSVPPGKLSDFGFQDATVALSLQPKLRVQFGNEPPFTVDAQFAPKDGGPPAPPPPLGAPLQVKLKASRQTLTATDDHSIVPRNFLGNVRTCTDCHNQAGKPTSYGATTIRGSAPNLSWHPFSMQTVNSDAMPVLDERWPLTRK